MLKDSSREDSNPPNARDAPTRMIDSAKQPPSSRSSTSYDSIDNARFVPGAMLAERHLIVGLLGKGGMGEVYRADDLKLGQAGAKQWAVSSEQCGAEGGSGQ